jgi:aminopeptidase N
MEKTCNCDLDWFFDQWAYGIGYPKVQFARHWAANLKTLHVIVTQTQPIDSLHPLFQFPATIRVITRDSVVRQQVMVRHQTDTFAIALPSVPLSFRFDEGGWLLGTVTGDLTPAELAQMAKHDLDIRARRWALAQLEASGDSVAADTRRFVALNEHSEWLRQVAVRQMARDSSAVSLAVVKSALRDPEPDVRAQALGTLASLDTAAGVAAATALYPTDPSNAVRQQALVIVARAHANDAVSRLVEATVVDQTRSMRTTAARLLRGYRDARAEAALERLTASTEDRNLRQVALQSLAATDSARGTAVALRFLGDPDPLFAVTAVGVVARTGGTDGKAKLSQALAAERRVTVRRAIRAMVAH